ncbi:ROK family transcriptional regulator [Agromyces endophyticus]|uniref:ROK family transcriptional regulator n=1 Tax=Agromyces sp. H17E-10 TaxID=2932244 RepID=UPI001FD15576|nr:ROK family transcriptional regulator [Agromyces sp. H17E-10]UOQ90719.1 ROK family transcriptional regulator [Agromyces sp. H17E-10]
MNDPIVGTARLKRYNTGRVLDELRAGDEPVRIVEIAERTGLTRSTVATIIDELDADGWLRRHDPVGSLGRPAARFTVASERFHVLGVDIGLHRVVAEVADAAGTVIAEANASHEMRDGRELLRLVNVTVDRALADAGLDRAAIAAVAVASVGMIDRAEGRVRVIRGIDAWTDLDLTRELGRGFDVAVDLDNDANLAALAMSELDDCPPSFLTVQWGERLGAGLVLDGRLYRGTLGAAGEIGALMVTDPWSGDRAPLEAVVGAERIDEVARLVAARDPFTRLASELGPEAAAAHVFERANDGERAATEIVDLLADVAARALTPILLALDLHRVYVTGGIARGGDVLTAALERRLTARGAEPIDVRLSPFAENTVVRGAVTAAVRSAWGSAIDGGLMPSARPTGRSSVR